MHGADSTTAPRFRLGGHRHTTIAFIQPRQQIRQTRPHRPESLVILDSHMLTLSRADRLDGNDMPHNREFTRLD
jgi:hypothetical protein